MQVQYLAMFLTSYILFTALFVPLPGQTHNKIMFDNVCDMGTPNSALWPLKVPINSGLWLALAAKVRAWMTGWLFLVTALSGLARKALTCL